MRGWSPLRNTPEGEGRRGAWLGAPCSTVRPPLESRRRRAKRKEQGGMEPIVLWDLDDDSDGNVAHIAEHGVTKEEVEDVLQNQDNETDASASSGLPITFGWTRTGK